MAGSVAEEVQNAMMVLQSVVEGFMFIEEYHLTA